MASNSLAEVLALRPLEERLDGWTSALTGLGTSLDKRVSLGMARDIISPDDALELYRGDALAKRIIKLLPDEMLREWWELQISPEEDDDDKETRTDLAGAQVAPPSGRGGPLPLDSPTRQAATAGVSTMKEGQEEANELIGIADDTQDYLEDLQFPERLHEALYHARWSGGGALFVGADDGATDLRRPLNMNAIKSIKFFTSFHARELQASSWNENPLTPDFGMPETYRIVPQTAYLFSGELPEVHTSRLIKFQGDVCTRRQIRENLGWGDSIFVSIFERLRDFNGSWGSTAALLADFAAGVFTMKGLSKVLANDKNGVLMGRLAAIQQSRSTVRAAVIDADGEKYERTTTPMGGLPEVLDKFMLVIAAASEYPVSLLFGQAPAGLQATGDSDIRFFYATVGAKQKRHLRPQLEQTVKMVFAAKNGPTEGKEPDGWHIHFKPLWKLTALEESEVRLNQAKADDLYIGNQSVMPEEVAQSRFGGMEWSADTHLNLDLRDAMSQEPPPDPPAPVYVNPDGSPAPVDPVTGKPAKIPVAKDNQ